MKKIEHYSDSLLSDWTTPPSRLHFQSQKINAHTEIAPHEHAWGQLNFIDKGVMEVELTGNQAETMEIEVHRQNKLISPWQYSIWLPAHVHHASYNKPAINYCSIAVPAQEAHKLPERACIIELTEVAQAIIKDFIQRNLSGFESELDYKMAEVLVELLSRQPPLDNFIPASGDKYLLPIINELQDNPGDNRTLKEWAETVYISDRSLTRRFQKEMGMSFRDWRMRLRFIRAVNLLKTDTSIQDIALTLGYSTSSAFIWMFNKISGTTPESYRKHHSG
ncbi:helix-turn-helix transcriptional regulator [Jejubacter calystegiae]|uniref:Helix-turn-helix transcriptional regulator n=1 Tax=Jejubacter calystegiae TaxID=2579935 RepID=A0A4P8YJ24_9ENTR|nr:helix-turn-helix transcriptional regulator [Jejubacter calystegiae]QCT20053.1 helix-turn-helix transcriptional regulator [Jejubacter calystegiae]